MRGIVAYGTYVPYFRLQRSAIAASLGTPPGKGTRAVAAYDEDATSMGVEAARAAMRDAGDTTPVGLWFSTTNPPYLDKTNATAIHAALGMDSGLPAYDVNGSVRSATAALTAAFFTPGPQLAVFADVRTGLPGGNDERDGGDGAAAILYGENDPVAIGMGGGHGTGEFLDRWRIPGEPASKVWEERFGETVYVPLAEQALNDALKRTGLTVAELDHVVVTGVHPRAARGVAKRLGARAEAYADDLTASIGNTGAAHPFLMLSDVLDRADPDQVIAVLTLADGADALIFRTTEALPAYRERRASASVREQIEAGNDSLDYASYLTWRGQLTREPPRRPDPDAPSAPPSHRNEAWKFAFNASKCTACGFRHLPPARVCTNCRAVDQMTTERLADTAATIATYTIDRLAFSLSPPTVAAVLDFDGGGRYTCELTDVDADSVSIGDRVELTFRKVITAKSIHNYFWKARPIRGGGEG